MVEERTVAALHPYFATLTFNPDKFENSSQAWLQVSSHTNRFIQKFRRTTGFDVHYLSAFESHKSFYPHVHLLLLLDQESLNPKPYVADHIRDPFRLAWTHGHTDIQQPYRGGIAGCLGYVLKYIIKTTSANRLWTRILSGQETQQDAQGQPHKKPAYAAWHYVPRRHCQCRLTHCKLTYSRVKILNWSRSMPEKLRELYIAGQSSK